jgi:hypothetical protein
MRLRLSSKAVVVGIVSKTHAVLVALKVPPSPLNFPSPKLANPRTAN